MIKIPGMELKIIRMHGHRGILELDDDFHSFAFGLSGKIQQRMLVQPELSEDAVQPRTA